MEPCKVLDVVTLVGVVGEEARGVITQIRRYPNSTLRYAVAVGDEGFVVDESNVRPTGEREPIDRYLPPGEFYPGDLVEVRGGSETLRGVIDGWFDDEGATRYTVWIPSTSILEVCDQDEILRIGPSDARRSGAAASTRVSESGEVLGSSEYVVLEDLMDLVADAAPR